MANEKENQGAAAPRTASHTPGPWSFDSETFLVRAHDGKLVVDVDSGVHDEPESTANGKLIAAAPELANALREALAEAEDCDPMATRRVGDSMIGGIIPRPHFAWREKARTALRSAGGLP